MKQFSIACGKTSRFSFIFLRIAEEMQFCRKDHKISISGGVAK